MFLLTTSLSFILVLMETWAIPENPKSLKVAFFLNEDAALDKLAITSATNYINNYAATQYSLNFILDPKIYRIKKNEIYNVGNLACDAIREGIAAIFGPENGEANEIIQSMALSLEIPQFQTYWNPNFASYVDLGKADKKETFNFNLYPSPSILSKAFATLVRENDWKSYTIIYENDDGLVRLQEVLKALSPNNPSVRYRKLDFGPDHRPILKEIVASGALHIILDCEADHTIDILSQAKEVKLFEEYHTYMITSLDAYTIDFRQLGEIKTNVSIIRMLNQKVVDTVIDNWELVDLERKLKIPNKLIKVNTAFLFDALNLFITAYSNLDREQEVDVKSLSCGTNEISTHGYRLSAFISMLNMTKGMLGEPISGLLNFNSLGQRISLKLQILELKKDEFRVTGIWDSNTPDVIHSTITSEDREKELEQQLKGRTFRVVSRIYPPYLSRKPGIDSSVMSGNNAFEGYAMDLMKGICELYECNYVFELVPDNNYGKYDPKTKEWNGLIGHLLARKADLAICDLTTTYERRKAVDFSNPFMTLGISILYTKIVKEPPDLLSFTNPLSLDVWLYMVTAYMVISMIIFLVARLNPNEWENPHPCNPNPEELENIWNIKNCFWLTLGSIMQQGCDILPKGISTRMVAGMWWFFTLIMISCYTANLAAFLTQERMGPTIQSAEDLAGQTKIKYGCLKDGATASFFRDSNVTTYHKMWVAMETADPSVFETSNIDGVKRVISNKGKYAFFMESSSIEYEVEKHCELVQVGNRLDTKGYGIAMPTNAPYRTSINQAILKMQEMGRLQRLKEKWWKEKNKANTCKKDEDSKSDSANELSLAHVGGVFVVLVVGMSIAMVIAVCEFLWHVWKIAVTQHVALKEVFLKELRFAMDIWCRQKPANPAANLNLSRETLRQGD
ncbi:glutamate receptor ionotropic, kainate 2-like isoform X1 [Tribolium madens]|uniref:glutamate receptor ionotropic, kainate 2-like isoform X1 n=2 Tax=Tribolium madens TaxID=41895 RepID=UPI001CF75600|nr:glutamate receptor ionotropic, kainate 2-like isoform X1 [Tribolium madens]